MVESKSDLSQSPKWQKIFIVKDRRQSTKSMLILETYSVTNCVMALESKTPVQLSLFITQYSFNCQMEKGSHRRQEPQRKHCLELFIGHTIIVQLTFFCCLIRFFKTKKEASQSGDKRSMTKWYMLIDRHGFCGGQVLN